MRPDWSHQSWAPGPAITSCSHHKSPWSSASRARPRDRLARRLMFVRDQYGSDPVTEQRFRSTLYTNTSTGDALNDPARDPPETRRERQCEVKVTSRCIHKVPKEVIDHMRPQAQLRDARNQERVSRSLGRPSASKRHENRQSPTTTAQSRRPLVAASKSIQAAHLPPMPPKKAAAGSILTVPSGRPWLASTLRKTCQLPRGARQKL